MRPARCIKITSSCTKSGPVADHRDDCTLAPAAHPRPVASGMVNRPGNAAGAPTGLPEAPDPSRQTPPMGRFSRLPGEGSVSTLLALGGKQTCVLPHFPV